MATASFGLPPTESLQLQQGNTAQKWKKFKQKLNNYEIATGVAKKDKPTRVTTLLTAIGEAAVDAYNTFTWVVTRDHEKNLRIVLERTRERKSHPKQRQSPPETY